MTRDPQVTSRIMSAVHNRDTGPEMRLRRELHRLGLRYRVHSPLAGRPDIVFATARVAVFVDGDYWHGNTWRLRGFDTLEDYYGRGNNGAFWVTKIKCNIARDEDVGSELTGQGWRVLRLWESEIHRDLLGSVEHVRQAIRADRPFVATHVA